MVGRCGMFGKILGLGRCISITNIVGVGSFLIARVIDNYVSIVVRVVVIEGVNPVDRYPVDITPEVREITGNCDGFS